MRFCRVSKSLAPPLALLLDLAPIDHEPIETLLHIPLHAFLVGPFKLWSRLLQWPFLYWVVLTLVSLARRSLLILNLNLAVYSAQGHLWFRNRVSARLDLLKVLAGRATTENFSGLFLLDQLRINARVDFDLAHSLAGNDSDELLDAPGQQENHQPDRDQIEPQK